MLGGVMPRIPFHSAMPAVIAYAIIWIGGLVFLGFFALLAPVTLVTSQARMSGTGELFELVDNQTVEAVTNSGQRLARAA